MSAASPAVIPQPADQIRYRLRRGSAGGRPPAFDRIVYKGRNVIEPSFNDHKQWRGIATRYDSLATVYRGAAVLRAIIIWLTALGELWTGGLVVAVVVAVGGVHGCLLKFTAVHRAGQPAY